MILNVLVDEESIQSRAKSLKNRIEKLSCLLENKKPLIKEDLFVDKMKLFQKKAETQLQKIETVIQNYKKEFSDVAIKFFMEDTKINVKEVFEAIATFLNDLQVSLVKF